MIFYDFEVFEKDWLVVMISVDLDKKTQKEYIICNNEEELKTFYENNKNDIWIGYNSKNYDQYILKGILCGFNPKEISDYIIVKGKHGWEFSHLLSKIQVINYDIIELNDGGLKFLEASMGNDIKETSVPFNIKRKLTDEEIEETKKYCEHDVKQTIEVFVQRANGLSAQIELVNLACRDTEFDSRLISKSKPQLSAKILGAEFKEHNDEFDFDFPNTLEIKKYTEVLDFYKNPENKCYKRKIEGRKTQENVQFIIDVAGVKHQFGYGGVHGAIPKYQGEGYFLNMDVASLYPSLMIEYNLHSRNMRNPNKFKEIYEERLALKKAKNPLQSVLKLVLNSTYGVMKDRNNALYDPLQANRVCVYGQLLLLDLIEKLEPYCEIIQSNTDGVLVKLPSKSKEKVYAVCKEWQDRTRLKLEFEDFVKVFQKDVNNYVLVKENGEHKAKGAYVKNLNSLNYNLPIVNRAILNYLVSQIPVEETIKQCKLLKEFQFIVKISNKFEALTINDSPIKERCVRVFASTDTHDGEIRKISIGSKKSMKIAEAPLKIFISNYNINNLKIPAKLDKNWYINLAKKRLNDFGIDIGV